jgi:long-subunit fatty acid transport protein
MDWSKAAVSMPFTLRGGDNPTINLLVNGDRTNGSFEYPFPLRWRDSWSLRAGVERNFASGNAVRAGFIAGQNPVPANTIIIAFPAVSQNSLTLGGTLNVAGIPVDASLVHAFAKRANGDAATHLVGSEYVGSSTTLSETVITFGTTLKF